MADSRGVWQVTRDACVIWKPRGPRKPNAVLVCQGQKQRMLRTVRLQTRGSRHMSRKAGLLLFWQRQQIVGHWSNRTAFGAARGRELKVPRQQQHIILQHLQHGSRYGRGLDVFTATTAERVAAARGSLRACSFTRSTRVSCGSRVRYGHARIKRCMRNSSTSRLQHPEWQQRGLEASWQQQQNV